LKIRKLDHIALYMSRRDAAAEFLTSHLSFHVVDHTERYTLVGAGGRLGKLTLFDAPEGTSTAPGAIERINVRVADPKSAADRLAPRPRRRPRATVWTWASLRVRMLRRSEPGSIGYTSFLPAPAR
jgi:catechol 2,3-dioxygenase-like lactoylglutathione lyase family enzyme